MTSHYPLFAASALGDIHVGGGREPATTGGGGGSPPYGTS